MDRPIIPMEDLDPLRQRLLEGNQVNQPVHHMGHQPFHQARQPVRQRLLEGNQVNQPVHHMGHQPFHQGHQPFHQPLELFMPVAVPLPRANLMQRQEKGTCVVCEEEFDMAVLFQSGCRHRQCKDCLTANVRSSMNSMPFQPVKCCFAIPSEQLESSGVLVGDDLHDYKLKVEELTNPYRKLYCWGPDCGAFISVSDRSQRVGKCSSCGLKTCKACRAKSHWGPCDKAKLQENQNAEEEVERLAETKGWKRCPNCVAMIQKTHGCSHMTCTCGQHFCYYCGQALDMWSRHMCTRLQEEQGRAMMARVRGAPAPQ